ncbi:MAG: hypothetical protein IJH67_08655 [Thermoguttaceae bacterium]|nr:hypothetical protein [Thermoguttaceae bacterium]
MNQREQVIDAMRQLGGYATFGQLNQKMDFSQWKSKTPEASVRRIVQQSDEFYRIQPGLWALTEMRSQVEKSLHLTGEQSEQKQELFTHSYFQGLLVTIGNFNSYQTWVPNQDKNKYYLEKPLHEIRTIENELPPFSYPFFIKQARTVDVIWFNERNMPHAFFEVEHTTNITNSLIKFNELQDFYANFYIVADQSRKALFKDILSCHATFRDIAKRVRFLSYQELTNDFENPTPRKNIINLSTL